MDRPLRSFAWLVSTASVVALAAGLSACTVNQAKATGADGGATADAAAAPPPGLSCLQILECIVACPDSDAACPDACAEKGDVEGKANVLAFAACVEKEKCVDAACTREKCAASIDTCVKSSAPKSTGSPLAGSAPPGSVPADLVGTWAGARDGITQRMTFNADGSASWMSSITSQQAACFSFTRTTRTGNAAITDTTITFYATSVVQSDRKCAPPDIETKLPAVTEVLQWHRDETNAYHQADPNTIFVVDSACAAKYPGQENCNTVGCPIGLYCTSRVTRE